MLRMCPTFPLLTAVFRAREPNKNMFVRLEKGTPRKKPRHFFYCPATSRTECLTDLLWLYQVVYTLKLVPYILRAVRFAEHTRCMYAYRAKFASKRGRKDKACYGVAGSCTRYADGGILRRVALSRWQMQWCLPKACCIVYRQYGAWNSCPTGVFTVLSCPCVKRGSRMATNCFAGEPPCHAVECHNAGIWSEKFCRRRHSVPTRVLFGSPRLWPQSRHLPHRH